MAKEKIKWDVSIADSYMANGSNNAYFDPELSYEITGYIPINETCSLDFDPEPFVAAGKTKLKTGKYCPAPKGSKVYKEFWNQEMDRITYGYKVGNYRVTGDMYFFLNYHPIMSAKDTDQTGLGREFSFPDFWVEHYKYTHYLEMAEKLKRDICLLKSRGVGMSEMAAACGERVYTAIKRSKQIYAAYDQKYLIGDGVLGKVWSTMDHLNQETEGGFKRLRQAKNSEFERMASVLNKQGEKSGHLAHIIGVIVDKPRKLRGARIDRLYFEEAGSFKDLGKAWTQSQALVEINGNKFGTRIAWGTGGDEGINLVGLESMFNNPLAYNILPYKHNNTPDKEYVYTGYFIPSWATIMKLMDKRGFVKESEGKAHYDKERELKKVDMKEYINHCAEFCYYPEEALSKQGENNFNQELLSEQYADVAIYKKYDEPQIGRLQPIYGSDDRTIVDVKFIEDPKGDIIIIEHPEIENGFPVKNLYVAGIDGIDHGADDSVIKNNGSRFCVAVKKRIYGIDKGDKYVCFYLKRPKDVREAYINTLKILIYYNCKANLEDTKIGFRTWLREKVKNEEKFLMKRPDYALSTKNKKINSLWGTPGSEKNIRHGLDLIESFVNDRYYTITWLPVIEQMKKFSYEAKGRFDIIMAMVYAEIADEDMYSVKVKPMKDSVAEHWKNKKIGVYTDEYGNKRWGTQATGEAETKHQFFIDPYSNFSLR